MDNKRHDQTSERDKFAFATHAQCIFNASRMLTSGEREIALHANV